MSIHLSPFSPSLISLMVSVEVKNNVYLLYGVTVSCLPVITNHLYKCTATDRLAPKRRVLDVYGGDGQTDRQTGRLTDRHADRTRQD